MIRPTVVHTSFALTMLLFTAPHAIADVLITNASVVDVEAGVIVQGQMILIEGGLISQVGTAIVQPETGVDIFDADGGYLIPGLWDSHVHIFTTPTEPDTALPLYLINGVTGIRDMGALWPFAEQRTLQTSIEVGQTLGPRLILSGAWVDAAPGSWPEMFLADTPAQAQAVVMQIAAEGWAAVKSYSMLDEVTY